MKRKTKFGLSIVAIYMTLVIAALMFTVVMVTKYPGKSEFAGVYIMVLTFPWSFAIFAPLGDHVNSMALLISSINRMCNCKCINTLLVLEINHTNL